MKGLKNNNKKLIAKFVSLCILGTSVSFNMAYASDDATTLATPTTLAPEVTNQNPMPSLAPMLQRVLPAVVSIFVEGEKVEEAQSILPPEFEFFFGNQFGEQQGQKRKFQGAGSGVIIDAAKGYVLTNNHVIADSNKITIKLNDGRELSAKVLGSDEKSDIALLQIKEPPKNLQQIKIADSNKLRVGDFVVAVGNPFGLNQSVTSGIVSALSRSFGTKSDSYENFIQTDAAVNRGNSGGPLLNLNGELIGINTSILAPSGGNVGIAFAIPSNMARSLVSQIVDFGKVNRGILGITGEQLNSDLVKTFKLSQSQGVFVVSVIKDSAADLAKLKAGDVIVALNGRKITSFDELRAIIATTGAGNKINVEYVRDGKSHKVDVVLQKEASATNVSIVNPIFKGVKLSNYSKNGKQGVLIDSMEKDAIAARYGLEEGDIITEFNGSALTSIKQLRDNLNKEGQDLIALKVMRDDSTFYVLIQ